MGAEADDRPSQPHDGEPEWDNLEASYGAPGARDVVPDMPPVPDVTTMDPPKNNWVWTHYEDGYHDALEPFPVPNREIVSEEEPLEVDVFYSVRSPYSYLSLFRLAYLNSNFNVNVNINIPMATTIDNYWLYSNDAKQQRNGQETSIAIF